MAYKIYFLGGRLSLSERARFYEPYKSRLEKLISTRAGGPPIVFETIKTCSKDQLMEILTDPATAGIIWFSHGAQSGDLLTKEMPRRIQDAAIEDDASSLIVNPLVVKRDLERSHTKISPNLQFLVLFSCYSAGFREEWKRLLPAGAKLKDTDGTLFGGTLLTASGRPIRDDVTRWLDNVRPERAEDGAASILGYAQLRLSTRRAVPAPRPPPTPRAHDFRWVKGKRGRWQPQVVPPRRAHTPTPPRPAIVPSRRPAPVPPPDAGRPHVGSVAPRGVRDGRPVRTGASQHDVTLGELRRQRDQEEARRRMIGRVTVQTDRRPPHPPGFPPRGPSRRLLTTESGWIVVSQPGHPTRVIEPSTRKWWAGEPSRYWEH